MLLETAGILSGLKVAGEVVGGIVTVATGVYTTTELLNETVKTADELFTSVGNMAEDFANSISDFFSMF